MNKKRYAFLNTLSNLLFSSVSLVFSMLTTRLILMHYGSDYNGLNSTIIQIINVMLIVESGFALSASVALYSPISSNNKLMVEKILSSVNYIFKKISVYFILVSIVSSLFIPLIIKSSVSYIEQVFIFLLTVIPIGFRLFFTVKYTTFFESNQENYILNFIKIIVSILVFISVYIISILKLDFYYTKVFYFIFNILGVYIIIHVFKRKHKNYLITNFYDSRLIFGVKDVLIKKITNIIYGSFPSIMIASTLGVKNVSVFGLYYLIIGGVSTLLTSLVSGPKDSLGLLVSENNKEKTYEYFQIYNLIITISSLILLSVTSILITPFVQIFTRGIDDVNYFEPFLGYVFSISGFFSITYGTYTHLLNANKDFRPTMIIQVIASIVLIGLGGVLTLKMGIIGMSIGILAYNLIEKFGKSIFAYRVYFKKGLNYIFRESFILLIISVFIIFIESTSVVSTHIITMYDFIIWGFLLTLISSIISVILIKIFFKDEFKYLVFFLFKRKKVNDNK